MKKLFITLIMILGLSSYFTYSSIKKSTWCLDKRRELYIALLSYLRTEEASCDKLQGKEQIDCDNALMERVDMSEKLIDESLTREGCTHD